MRAETDGDDRRVVANHAAAEHEHAAGRHAGNAAEQHAAPAERLLEEVRACLRRQPARDLAHRREQREAPVLRLDRLVRNSPDAAVDECARQRLVGGDVQIREEDEIFAQPRILDRDRLLHLEEQLRLLPDVVEGDDLRARAHVVVVRHRASVAGRRLDEHVVPLLHELARARRRERDAVLVGLDLLGNADPHDARTIPTPNRNTTRRP